MKLPNRSYFEQIDRDCAEPWEHVSALYEQRKDAVTVASLPRSRYRSAYEPGCSVGLLTELLALRCDRLLSSDIVPSTLEAVEARLGSMPHVGSEERSIPAQWPSGQFDLVVLSEIAYSFDVTDLHCVMGCVMSCTVRGAHVVGVHWRGETGHLLSGDRSHQIIAETPGLVPVVHHSEEEFVLDIWERW